MNTCVKSVFSLPSVQAMQEKVEAKAEAIQVSPPGYQFPLSEAHFRTPSGERKGIPEGREDSSHSCRSCLTLGSVPHLSWPEQALDNCLVNKGSLTGSALSTSGPCPMRGM